MEKTARTTIVSALLILIAISELPFPATAQGGQEVTLYLYGENPTGDMGYFLTDAPTSMVGESNNYGASGGVILQYVLGTWETEPLQKDLHINGLVTVAVWLENEEPLAGSATVTCEILINGEQTGQELESDETTLDNSPQELVFTGLVDAHFDAGDSFGIYMMVSYMGLGFIFYWAHASYDSHISVPADWVSIDIAEPIIDEDNKEALIEATVIDALGTDEIVNYDIHIDGPTIASSISGPELSQQGNAMIASWVWDFGADNAESGALYTAEVIVTDNSGNEWIDTEDFYVSAAPPPPPIYNWTIIGQITNYVGDDAGHSLMIDNDGTFWLAYSSERSGNFDIWAKNSLNGVVWSDPIQVTTNESFDMYCSMIQDSEGTYWMAWHSDRSGVVQIWMSSSSDGVNWDEPYQVVSLMDENAFPSLIQDSTGTYWLAWMNIYWETWDIHLYVSSSSDALTWTTPTQVTSSTTDNWEPSLIQDDTGTYRLVWDASIGGDWELFGTYSNDGVNWATPFQITSHGSDNWYPSLIQNASGGFDIAFASFMTDDWEIWRISSMDGLNWGTEERVTNLPDTNEFDPSLVQDNGETFWVAWASDITGNIDIWMSNKPANNPPSVMIFDIVGEQDGDISVEYLLRDADLDLCGIEPEFSTNGVTFYPTTRGAGGDGITDLTSSSSGIVHTYVWASGADLPGIDDSTVYFRITPFDLSTVGQSGTTNAFHVDNNAPPIVEYDPISGERSEDVLLDYRLVDAESDTVSIMAEYSLDGQLFSQATIGSGGDPISDLASSPEGTQHSFVWDSNADLGSIDDETVYFRVTPSDTDIGESFVTEAFHLDNNDPPWVETDDLSGENTQDVIISYMLMDSESDTLSIIAEYSEDGENFSQAAKGSGGDPISDLLSSPEGTQHYFVWDSKADLDGIDDETIYFRITPSDADTGTSFMTNPFHVDNNEVPEVVIDTPTGVQSGGVLISYTLKDKESDSSNILVEHSRDGVSYYSAAMGYGGEGKTDLTSSPKGTSHNFLWNSNSNLGQVELSTVYIRITPRDNDEGSPAITEAFSIDNKEPRIISGPTVASSTETSVKIEWKTDEPCNSIVRYGTSTISEFEKSSSDLVTAHAITLTGLEPDTGYLYSIFSTDQAGNGPVRSTELMFFTEKNQSNPPTITIFTPEKGKEVKGKILVSGTASDPDDYDLVEYVEIRIDDGKWSQATGTFFWFFDLDTTSLDNGKHTIYIRAYDGEFYSEEKSITIKVDNQEETNLWLLVGIGAVILVACITIAAVVILKRRRRPQETRQFVPDYMPEPIVPSPTIAYEDFEEEPIAGYGLEW